jgi:hypothetical protein
MVEFCTSCGTSLPKGDVSVKGGKLFTSPDYTCPSCGKLACPEKASAASEPDPTAERDIVIKGGKSGVE